MPTFTIVNKNIHISIKIVKKFDFFLFAFIVANYGRKKNDSD